MRILIIADTHIHSNTASLPAIIKKEAQKSDYCIHAGDFVNYNVFLQLNKLIKTYAVAGNMDSDEVRNKLPQKEIITIEDVKLAVTHGEGAPESLINYMQTAFAKEMAAIDVFVFGHSHQPCDREIKGKIYFNPGSPTDDVFAPYRSYGIMEITGKTIKRRIVKIG